VIFFFFACVLPHAVHSELNKHASIADCLDTLQYGPAPEVAGRRRRVARLAPAQARPLHQQQVGAPGRPQVPQEHVPGEPRDAVRDDRRRRRPTSTWPCRRRAPRSPRGRRSRRHERAKHLYSIARHVQKHHRLLAVLESLDNGKPMRETRDSDIPLVARHFYHHAGWAQLMDAEMPDWTARSASSARSSRGTSRCMLLAWKVCPGARHGQHRRRQAGQLHAPLGAALCEIVRRGRPAAGRRQRHLGSGDDRAPTSPTTPTSTRSPSPARRRSAACSAAASPARARSSALELGGKSPFIVFDNADLDAVD
jgi:aldehyde dehydrogenase (NAD+)